MSYIISKIREHEYLYLIASQEITVNYDHSCFSVNRVAKGFSVTRGGTQIISVMRDRAQMSRVRRDLGWQRYA